MLFLALVAEHVHFREPWDEMIPGECRSEQIGHLS